MFFFLTLHTATCDPHASYNDFTTVDVGSVKYTRLITRMESNSKIVIQEESENKVTFVTYADKYV